MTDRGSDDRTARTAAVLGGGALLVWLVLHGRRLGVGLGASAGETGGYPVDAAAAPAPCHVRVDGTGIELDGARTNLPATVARCRTVGAADVVITGDAIQGVVDRLLTALHDVGVVVLVTSPGGRIATAGSS